MTARHEAGSPAESLYDRTRAAAHLGCFLCGRSHPTGPRLEFQARENGSVVASFACDRRFGGYGEVLHGGVIAALLDAAMTNCLFARGVVAVTAELTVRYLSPVMLDHPAELSAAVSRVRGPLYYLNAELRQNGTLAARARATFMESGRASRSTHPDHSPHAITRA